MAYQVIARKWRPQTFEEVTGQEHITRMLRNAIAHDRLHHAYLFSGSRGVGKTTTARLLAKAVNCRHSDKPTATPCLLTNESACESCREIADGRSIDVLEVDAASNTGVGNVRDSIIDMIDTHTVRDRYKVFIIDEVHMLSNAAFNALLKTLEEPPANVIFIMATTHAYKLPETIRSRSQQFEFHIIEAKKISERLRFIAEAELITISEDALNEIARAGQGSMRDAQSAFDQVISFSDGMIEVDDVEAALGVAGSRILAKTMLTVANQQPPEMIAIVEELTTNGQDLMSFCRDLMTFVRNLLVFKIRQEYTKHEFTELEAQLMKELIDYFSESDLIRFFNSLSTTETLIRSSLHPRFQLEIGLIKLVEMRRLTDLGKITERLTALEESLTDGELSM
jgi:DNA polymerase-3 subunit gamma/tau